MSEVPKSAATPVCYRHPSRETYVRCSRCDRPICPSCMNAASVGHQCPECVAEGRRTQRPVRTAFGATRAGVHGYVTKGLIAVNGVMLILSALSTGNPARALFGGGLGGLLGTGTPLSVDLGVVGEQTSGGITFPIGVANGEYYRLLTAMFMHYGLLHLALNMYALWIMGRQLEAMLGPVRFLAIYLVCGIGGNVAAYVFSPGAVTAGASTALFGLFGVYFFVLRKLSLSASGLVPILVLNLFITISVPGISIAGHVGGLITGCIVGYGVSKAPQQRRGQIQTIVIAGMLLVLGVVAVVQTLHLNAGTLTG